MNCEAINYNLALKKSYNLPFKFGYFSYILCGALDLYSKKIRCSLKMATAFESYKVIFINYVKLQKKKYIDMQS